MTSMTATEAKNKFGELADQARSGPIAVTRSGRPVMVILSAEEFDHLAEIEDRYWGERALDTIRTQKPLGVEATAQWLEEVIEDKR